MLPIAVTATKWSPQLPDVPTFAELGLPAVETYAWYGTFAPARTPNDVVATLNTEALKIMTGRSSRNCSPTPAPSTRATAPRTSRHS